MRLTNVEKYAIQGMVADGKDAAWIAKSIKKPESTVVEYVFKIAQSIVKVEEVKASLPCPPDKDHTDVDVTAPTKTPEEIAEEEAVAAHEKAMETPRFNQENVKETAIAGRKKAGEFILNKTQGDKSGVAMMTGAASALAEERAKHYNHQQARNQQAIFKPKGN